MVVAVDETGAFKGKPRSLTRDMDRSVDEFIWFGPAALLIIAEDNVAP